MTRTRFAMEGANYTTGPPAPTACAATGEKGSRDLAQHIKYDGGRDHHSQHGEDENSGLHLAGVELELRIVSTHAGQCIGSWAELKPAPQTPAKPPRSSS